MKRRGFSLVEVIAVLVLVAIMAGIVGLMLTSTVQRYTLERNAAASNQKAETATARIAKELDWANWATVEVLDGGRTLRWTSTHPDRVGAGLQTLSWSGTNGDDLTLGGSALADSVALFQVADTVASGFIEVELQLTHLPTVFRVRATAPEED